LVVIAVLTLVGFGIAMLNPSRQPRLQVLVADSPILWVTCDSGTHFHGYLWHNRPLNPTIGRFLTSVDVAALHAFGKRIFNVSPYSGLGSRNGLFIQVGVKAKQQNLPAPYRCDLRVTFTDQHGVMTTNNNFGGDDVTEEFSFAPSVQTLHGCKLEFFKVDHSVPFELYPTNGLGR